MYLSTSSMFYGFLLFLMIFMTVMSLLERPMNSHFETCGVFRVLQKTKELTAIKIDLLFLD